MKHGFWTNKAWCFLLSLLILFLFPLALPEASASEVQIICNKDVPDSSLSKSALRNTFLGKKTEWGDGQKITFVALKGGDAHKTFCKNYIKKSSAQFLSYWKKMMFTGKGQMPKFFKDEQEMLNFVANNEGAVGYISASVKSDQVKAMAIN